MQINAVHCVFSHVFVCETVSQVLAASELDFVRVSVMLIVLNTARGAGAKFGQRKMPGAFPAPEGKLWVMNPHVTASR